MTGYGEAREISTANEISGSVAGPVVQAAIVNGDIHLHNAPHAGNGRTDLSLPTPRQLPRVSQALVAREREFELLDQWAAGETGSGLMVLTGPAGVGKAAVALAWLQRESDARYPDGQLYADLRSFGAGSDSGSGSGSDSGSDSGSGSGSYLGSPVRPLGVLRGFLAALGVPPESIPPDLAGSAALFRSATAGRRMAVMLHGATSAAQVRPLIPGGGSCVTLVTSTWRLGGLGMDGARWLAVAPLGDVAAVSLLSALAGSERISFEAEAAREVVSLCGGLPLALCMVGNRLAFNPYQRLGRLAAELRDERRRLDRLTEESESGGVRNIIDACYRGLPADAAFLYRVLGALPLGRFGVVPAAAGAAVSEEDASGLLRMLSEASLLQQVGEDTYQFHELVRLHAREMTRGGGGGGSGDAAACEEAVVRVERWYLATAIAAATAVRPYRRDRAAGAEAGAEAEAEIRDGAGSGAGARAEAMPRAGVRAEAMAGAGIRAEAGVVAPRVAFETQRAALDWLDGEAPQLLSVAAYAAEHGRPRTALGIALQMWSLFAHRKYYRIWQEFDLLGLRCARQLGDFAAEARMLRRLGMLSNDLGRYEEATGHFGAAAALYERLGDQHRHATVINSLGVVAIRRGDLGIAIGRLSQALAMHEALGGVRQCALVRVDLGNALIQAGRPGDAMEQLRLADEHLHQSPDLSSGARLRMLKGRARGQLGDLAGAEGELGAAVESMRALSSVSGQAEALGYRGELAERSGVPTEAELYYEQAAELLDRLGTPSSGWLRERISGLSPLAARVIGRGGDPSGRP